MELKDLVPPLELCKLIPEGEFSESALCYVGISNKFYVIETETYNCFKYKQEKYPAPTLQEILLELDEFEVWGNNISKEHTVISEFLQYEDENTATAGLKVWLKLKGIEE